MVIVIVIHYNMIHYDIMMSVCFLVETFGCQNFSDFLSSKNTKHFESSS